MLGGTKKKEKGVILDRPPSLTLEQMIEDVEAADPDDYVFKFIEALDEDVETFSRANEEEDDEVDDSEDEFYEVRDTFETDPTFVFETIDQRYERMCEFVKERDGLLANKKSMEESCQLLNDRVASTKDQLEKLKLDVHKHLETHQTPEFPTISSQNTHSSCEVGTD